jgi:predicted DNA-binding protein
MPDRHRVKPLSLRLPEALSAWVYAQAEQTGKPVRRIITEAVETAKEQDERRSQNQSFEGRSS